MMTARFALIGKSGSGKSFAGRFLSAQTNSRHIKTGAICRQISRLLFDDEDKRSTQLLDDALTAINPSIFLSAALRSVMPDDRIVIDALRFQTDLELAKQYGCRTIRIVAPEEIRLSRLKERGQVFDLSTDGTHRTETELDHAGVDFEVQNDGGVAEFEEALMKIVARL